MLFGLAFVSPDPMLWWLERPAARGPFWPIRGAAAGPRRPRPAGAPGGKGDWTLCTEALCRLRSLFSPKAEEHRSQACGLCFSCTVRICQCEKCMEMSETETEMDGPADRP